MVSIVWNQRATLNWQLLPRCSNSNFSQQQAVLKPVLSLLNNCPGMVWVTESFSIALGQWLDSLDYASAPEEAMSMFVELMRLTNSYDSRIKTRYVALLC